MRKFERTVRYRIIRWLWIGLVGSLLTTATWIGPVHSVGVAAAQEAAKAAERRPLVLDRPPIRAIENLNPVFSAIAMDGSREEVYISNDNEASPPSVLVYPAQFAPTDQVMEPRRRIAGPKAHLELVCGLAVSPENKEIYTASGDVDKMNVFPLDANGDLFPSRVLNVSHGSGGVFLDAKNNELYITTEHVNRISIYRREAQGEEDPLRYIQGPNTGLADPHGIYVDNQRNEILVTNHGNWRKTEPGEAFALTGDGKLARMRGSQSHRGIPEELGPSTGKFMPPSVIFYPRAAQGNVAPLRTIQGTKTRLNIPLGIYRDPVSGQIVIANAGDDSVLFFDANATGDVAPARVIKGTATEVKGPTGVLIDAKRDELWVTNWDNHTVSVFPRLAQGNVAPLRVIRSAPKGATLSTLGRAGAVAYDPKRDEILVPN